MISILNGMSPLAITSALLMLPDGPRRLTLRIDGSRIATIGGSPQPGDRVLDLTGYTVFPGLINAHDQLHLNALPRTKTQEYYSHAQDWFRDLQIAAAQPAFAARMKLPLKDRVFIGAIKNLLAGATTVLHHGAVKRFMHGRHAPIRVVEDFGWADSLYAGQDILRCYQNTPADSPFIIRIAEGFDEHAASELTRLAEANALQPNTVIVHGQGLTGDDVAALQEANAGLIWTPETNQFILGRTHAPPVSSGHVALGTGPRLTGSLDLLEEMKVALLNSQLQPLRIIKMVTVNAAKILRLPASGRLARNVYADLIVIDAAGHDPYDALLRARRADLKLIIHKGEARIGATSLHQAFKLTGVTTVQARLDGVSRLVAQSIARRYARNSIHEPGLELL